MRYLSLILALIITLHGTAYAGWVDDWLQQKTEISPNYFEGQKRGYYSGGSFSARWAMSSDYPVTVMPPKLRAGCGGIDAFMGGFSFLNFDYLVQKMQNMIQAAPAIAFDIALQTLSEQLSNSVKGFENIIDKLNSINLDECKAGKAIVATLMDPVMGKKMPAEYQSAVADFLQSSGIQDFWGSVTKETKANNDNPPSADYSAMMEGCPQDVKDLFATEGSVVSNIAQKFGASDYADLIRGLVGDVVLHKTNQNLYHASLIEPCGDNDQSGIEALLTGQIKAKSVSDQCYEITDTNKDLRQWATSKMVTVASHMKSKGTLTSDDLAFLQASPLNTGLVLKYAVRTEQEGSIIANLADVTAKAYAYHMIADLYYRTLDILYKAEKLASAQSNATANKQEYTCKIDITGAPEQIKTFANRVYRKLNDLRVVYSNAIREVNALYAYAQRMNDFDEFSQQYLTVKFGESTAKRASGI